MLRSKATTRPHPRPPRRTTSSDRRVRSRSSRRRARVRGCTTGTSAACAASVYVCWARRRTPPKRPRRHSCGCCNGCRCSTAASSTSPHTCSRSPATSATTRSKRAGGSRWWPSTRTCRSTVRSTSTRTPSGRRCCGHARRARAANASLPPRRREVVALRELESLPYAQIGEIVGLKENAVAQLISRARVGLRNAVPTRFRGRALQSVGPATDECGRALPLLATVQDGQDGGGAGAPARVRGGGAGAGRAHSRGIGPCRPCEALRRRRGSSVRARSPTRAAAGPPNWDCVGAPAGGHRRR